MEQIVLRQPGQFELREAPRPEPRPNEALCRVLRIGVCGTDLNAFAGRQAFFDYPRVLGHELAVEVLELPTGLETTLQLGEICAVEPYLACGRCTMCQSGRRNCCPQASCLGVHLDGGMQEYLAVDAKLLHLSAQLDPDQLALVETLGIGGHAVERGAPQSGQSVLVVGLGPIGLAVVEFSRLIDCRLAVTDRSPERCDYARSLGIEVVESPESAAYDVVFDATGNRQSMEACVDRVAFGGTLVFVGIVNESIAVSDPLLHRRELTIKGTRNSANLFPAIIQRLETGQIDLQPWISRKLAFAEVPEKFHEIRRDPRMIKTVIDVAD